MGSDKLFSVLLHLYPAAFREEYEEEMRLAFRRRRREETGTLASALLWLHTVLVCPLPYAQSDRVVRIWETNPSRSIPFFSASLLNFL